MLLLEEVDTIVRNKKQKRVLSLLNPDVTGKQLLINLKMHKPFLSQRSHCFTWRTLCLCERNIKNVTFPGQQWSEVEESLQRQTPSTTLNVEQNNNNFRRELIC